MHAPFGLQIESAVAALGAMDPAVAAEVTRLVRLALSFRATTIQAVTILPVLR